jgi:hypothetical protein
MDKYYIVDLRCGTCGVIFASTSRPVKASEAGEYEAMFKERGPAKFPTCKNRCPVTSMIGIVPAGKTNLNQVVHKTIIPNEELKEFGLMA